MNDGVMKWSPETNAPTCVGNWREADQRKRETMQAVLDRMEAERATEERQAAAMARAKQESRWVEIEKLVSVPEAKQEGKS